MRRKPTILQVTRTRGIPADGVSRATVEEMNMPETWVDVVAVEELSGAVATYRLGEVTPGRAIYSRGSSRIYVYRRD